ncbi:hypothetical protein SMMN14_09024, partial [Sphaerulina musiva]
PSSTTDILPSPSPDSTTPEAQHPDIPTPTSPLKATDSEHPCTTCGGPRSRRTSIVSDPNVFNSRAGRTYHPCTNTRCPRGRANTLDRDWHTWQVHGENPKCDCGLPSRQSRQGTGEVWPGYGVWECAFGGCGYRSRDRKGRSVEKGEVRERDVDRFIPWLLNGR